MVEFTQRLSDVIVNWGGTSELGGLNIQVTSSYAEIIYRLPELLDKNLAEDEDPAWMQL